MAAPRRSHRRPAVAVLCPAAAASAAAAAAVAHAHAHDVARLGPRRQRRRAQPAAEPERHAADVRVPPFEPHLDQRAVARALVAGSTTAPPML